AQDPRIESCLARDPRIESCLARDPRIESCLARDPRTGSCLAQDPRIESCLARDQHQPTRYRLNTMQQPSIPLLHITLRFYTSFTPPHGMFKTFSEREPFYSNLNVMDHPSHMP